MSLRCFIAIPIGHADIDAVYDKLVFPALRARNITPVRVDRLEFNDDIDNRIILELEKCNCAIADLTYARPSVYFEAGFAQRLVPVIYTCRNDHLSPQPNDQFGNFKIHFDLQMKNIISWRTYSDQNFFKKLERRIDHTFGPLIRVKESQKIKHEESQKFLSYSLEKRQEQIIKLAIASIQNIGYREVDGDVTKRYEKSPLSKVLMYSGLYKKQGFPISFEEGRFGREYIQQMQFIRILSLSPRWLGTKYFRGGIKAVFIHVASNLTKKKIIDLHDSILTGPLYSISTGEENKALRYLDEHFIICIFQKITISRIMDSLSSFSLNPNTGELVWNGKQAVPTNIIPGYTEVFALPNILTDMEYLYMRNRTGISVRDQEGYRFEIKDNKIYKTYGDEKVGQVRRIPRQVTIHIIDAINSEIYFSNKLETLISKL